MAIVWNQVQNIPSQRYKCGFCGNPLASEKGLQGTVDSNRRVYICICHNCNKPTFIDVDGKQYPGAAIGNKVKHIPKSEVEKLFEEARSCYTISAFSSSVMCCRKLLMNIAVAEGAKEGIGFIDYVNYLNDNNYIPPNGKKWVDEIRKLGNETNHKITLKTQPEAEKILLFTEMLLRFIYEMPGIMSEGSEHKP